MYISLKILITLFGNIARAFCVDFIVVRAVFNAGAIRVKLIFTMFSVKTVPVIYNINIIIIAFRFKAFAVYFTW